MGRCRTVLASSSSIVSRPARRCSPLESPRSLRCLAIGATGVLLLGLGLHDTYPFVQGSTEKGGFTSAGRNSPAFGDPLPLRTMVAVLVALVSTESSNNERLTERRSSWQLGLIPRVSQSLSHFQIQPFGAWSKLYQHSKSRGGGRSFCHQST